MQKKYTFGWLWLLLVAGMFSCQKELDFEEGEIQDATVTLIFKNKFNSNPLVIGQTYTNPFGESITINLFKYYISSLELSGTNRTVTDPTVYHLADASIPGSMTWSFKVPVSTYKGVAFRIGVDSARNVSGAQTGALDPVNGMFWTWNSGYIMAKMEGTSPVSKEPQNLVAYHIGGFNSPNNTARMIAFNFNGMELKGGQTLEITLDAELNGWFKSSHSLKIADQANVTEPGPLAALYADNYQTMFTISSIK